MAESQLFFLHTIYLFLGLLADREIALLDDKLNQRIWQFSLILSHFFQLQSMDGLRILLLKFVIGHQHYCNGQIEQEEGADNDTSHEVKDDKERHCHIPEHVHDGSPALHRDALEDCHEGRAYVVEIGHAVV